MQKTTKIHIAINVLCFITIMISLYFGMSVFNARDNQHITHLNSFDNYAYYAVADIGLLTAQAVIIAGIFVLTAFGLQIYSYFLTKSKIRKQVNMSLLLIYFIIFFFSFYVMGDYENRDFYYYGMIWVLLSLTLIFANSVLIFLRTKD